MYQLQFADEIAAAIRARDGRYHEQAYLFVLGALEFCQQRRPARGHISGGELAWACRDYALDQFGLTARTVLQHWGVTGTDDLGRMVYTLIELGLLQAQPQDRIEDFDMVYEFERAFDDYPWAGVRRADERP